MPPGNLLSFNETVDYGRKSNVEYALRTSAETGATLLPDAKLYVFAQYLGLNGLERLAFQNLQAILVLIQSIDKHLELVTNVVGLARFVYECRNAVTEPLRKLVFAFVTAWLPVLHGPALEDLIWEGGDFAVDMMGDVEHRISRMALIHEQEMAHITEEMNQLTNVANEE
ncbi:MAG: hypothetical protein Q9170_001631 [Blastenia crenularia]